MRQRDKSQGMGRRVDEHCPYDEATLRVDLDRPGRHICPCCHTSFEPVRMADKGEKL